MVFFVRWLRMERRGRGCDDESEFGNLEAWSLGFIYRYILPTWAVWYAEPRVEVSESWFLAQKSWFMADVLCCVPHIQLTTFEEHGQFRRCKVGKRIRLESHTNL